MRKIKGKKILLTAFMIMFFVSGIIGCSSSSAPTQKQDANTSGSKPQADNKGGSSDLPIVIGHTAVLSGGMASLGEGGSKALAIWSEQINKNGGLLGRQVKVIKYDSQGKVDKAIENVKQAVQKDKVDFIITTDTSGVVVGVTPLGNELKVPIIHATGAADNFQNVVTRYTFRVADPAIVFGYAAAKIASEKHPNVKTWAGINPDYEWGHSVWEAFKKEMKIMNPDAQFVTELWPPFGEKDFKPFITQLQASKAEGIFTSLWSGDEINFIKQAKMFNLFNKFKVYMDSSSTNFEVAMGLKNDMIKTIGTAFYYFEGKDSTGINEKFVNDWKEKYGENDVPISSAGSTYAAAQLLAEAVKKAGTTDALSVVKALENLKFNTVMGELTIREHDHQAIRTYIPSGVTGPNSKYPYWTWNEYTEVPIPADLMPESNYKGWKANN